MPRREVLHTSLPEARLLLAEYDRVDGSREITRALYDIVKALFPPEGGDRSPGAPAETPDAGVMIPELQAVIDRAVEMRMQAETRVQEEQRLRETQPDVR